MPFTLPELPYESKGLEPHMSEKVVSVHYDKHTRQYFKIATELAAGTTFEHKTLESILKNSTSERLGIALLNNVSQAWNHVFFWEGLAPESKTGSPSDKLMDLISTSFVDLQGLKTEFNTRAAEVFGSGWAWLIFKDQRLSIKTTPNGGSTLPDKAITPLLACDVWEHAYYLQYQSDRKQYLNAFWNIVNWNKINDRLQQGTV